MTRTKTSKETLESIGFQYHRFDNHKFSKQISSNMYLNIYLKEGICIIGNEYSEFPIPRKFTYIDEVTTLLTGLTGKTQFRK